MEGMQTTSDDDAVAAKSNAVESVPLPSTQGGHIHSPLFKLLPELRNQIYDYVFDNAGPRKPTLPSKFNFYSYSAQASTAPMQVCRALRQETLPLYYSRTKAMLRGNGSPSQEVLLAKSTRDWLADLDSDVLYNLRLLDIRISGFGHCCMFNVVLRCGKDRVSNLKILCSRTPRHERDEVRVRRRAEFEEVVESVFFDGYKVVVTSVRIKELFKGLAALMESHP